jgi:IS5 family transposase
MCILVKKLADMVGKQDKTPQLSIFDTPLERFINLNHELCILSGQIDWDSIEQEFSIYLSDIGRSSVPIRRMIVSVLPTPSCSAHCLGLVLSHAKKTKI